MLVVRYGAFGDGIIITPALKQLKKDGYHVTLNSSDYCAPVFDNNPNIDEIIVHQRDSVPNQGSNLGDYWNYLSKPYDKFINLSGSLEGSLLLLEGTHPLGCDLHRQHYVFGCDQCELARECRDTNLGHTNYYDKTMALAGYPDIKGTRGELFFSHGELFKCRDLMRKNRRKGNYVVMWSLAGSSFHKAYPYWATAAVEFCRRHPDVVVYSVGDEMSALAEVDTHPRIFPRSGKWKIRESMCMTQMVDLVVGGETGILHAAACYDTPKVVLLSHSTQENLTKYWTNCIALEPDRKEAPCYPCHQLHYTKESCPVKHFPTILHMNWDGPPIIQPPPNDDSQTWPVCMTHAISIDRVLNAMEYHYERKRQRRVN